MCLVGVALGLSRRYPLVVASNRDEYMDRPSQALDWWSPWPEGPPVLSGRDLRAGGTWMGLSQAGRFALVTNVRQPFAVEPDAPSRGQIPLGWLRGDLPADRFWPRTALSGHAPFNLLAADFPAGEFFWTSNQHPHPQRLTRGVHGLSNAALDTPWPKVERIKQRLSAALGRTCRCLRCAARSSRLWLTKPPLPTPSCPRPASARRWSACSHRCSSAAPTDAMAPAARRCWSARPRGAS